MSAALNVPRFVAPIAKGDFRVGSGHLLRIEWRDMEYIFEAGEALELCDSLSAVSTAQAFALLSPFVTQISTESDVLALQRCLVWFRDEFEQEEKHDGLRMRGYVKSMGVF